MKNFKACIDATLFARAAACQSKDPVRHYLCGVYVEPCPAGGAILTATDGTILITAYDAEATVEGAAIVSLPAHMLKECKEGKGGRIPRITIDGQNAVIATNKGDEALAWGVLIDGPFPDWRRVLPKAVGGATEAAFDAAMFARLGAAVAPGKAYVRVSGDDARSPHWMQGADKRVAGVIVPLQLRASGMLDVTIPNWA